MITPSKLKLVKIAADLEEQAHSLTTLKDVDEAELYYMLRVATNRAQYQLEEYLPTTMPVLDKLECDLKYKINWLTRELSHLGDMRTSVGGKKLYRTAEHLINSGLYSLWLLTQEENTDAN